MRIGESRPAATTAGPIPKLFRQRDLEEIRRAAAQAETGSGGEVVSYVVGRCDRYDGATWRGTAVGSLIAAVLAPLVHEALGLWGGGLGAGWFWAWWVLPPFLGAGLGYALVEWVPSLKRALIPPEVLERRVRLRAEAAFLEEEVFLTRDRTGVLIFLALFEHRVVVLGDEGINSRVEPEEWVSVAADLASGIRQGRPAAALVEAIEACGDLLRQKRVPRRKDDEDELSNELRVRED